MIPQLLFYFYLFFCRIGESPGLVELGEQLDQQPWPASTSSLRIAWTMIPSPLMACISPCGI